MSVSLSNELDLGFVLHLSCVLVVAAGCVLILLRINKVEVAECVCGKSPA